MKKWPLLPLEDRDYFLGLAGGDLEALKERFHFGKRYLVVYNDRVELCGEQVLRPRYRAGFPIFVIVDLRRALQNFTDLVGSEERTFSLMQIAQVTGMPYQKAWKWLSDGLIAASIDPAGGHGKERVFSFLDAFIAALLVHLRRSGMGTAMLPRVAQLLRRLEPMNGARERSASDLVP